MDREEILDVLKESGALLDGHFELRSGLHSDRFFQCAHVLSCPKVAERLCVSLAERVRCGLGDGFAVECVIAPAMGGIVVGHELARALDVRAIFAEKRDDRLVLRRFDIRKGDRLVVAEDVVTRGGRVSETIDIVKACGGEVVAVAILVDRSGGDARFEYPTFSLLEEEPITYEPRDCPLCRKGEPLIHPGS